MRLSLTLAHHVKDDCLRIGSQSPVEATEAKHLRMVNTPGRSIGVGYASRKHVSRDRVVYDAAETLLTRAWEIASRIEV